MKVSLIAVAVLTLAAQANAISVRDCDGTTDSARNIVEPWDKNTRLLADKNIRITSLDTGGEPACCSAQLMVTFPSSGKDEPVFGLCKLIAMKDAMGFSSIDFKKLQTKYDAKTGLAITFPYTISNDSGAKQLPGIAKLRLDLNKGELVVQK